MNAIRILTAVLCIPLLTASVQAAENKPERIEVKVQIPDTADALWAEIEAKTKALAGLVTAQKKDETYATAETVEALVNAIPSKYPALAADKKKRVEGQVKNTARVLDELHDVMDAGKADEAAKKLAQVEAALKIIKGQVGK